MKKKKRLYAHDFSADFDNIDVADIFGIHKYCIKKKTQYKMFEFI